MCATYRTNDRQRTVNTDLFNPLRPSAKYWTSAWHYTVERQTHKGLSYSRKYSGVCPSQAQNWWDLKPISKKCKSKRL